MKSTTTPRQRSIPFSPLMVAAIRANKKTQTRRAIKPQPNIDEDSGFVFDGKHRESYKNDILHRPWQEQFIIDWCPYQIGDVLLVGEAWRTNQEYDHLKPSELPADADVWFDAEITEPQKRAAGRYRNARFLPFAFRRLKLEVVAIRVERLSDISEEDAIAEGVNILHVNSMGGEEYENYVDDCRFEFFAADSFKTLWQKINGPDSLAANPWVFAYTFKLL